MRGKGTYYWATRSDIEPGLIRVEADRKVKYVLATFNESPKVIEYSSYVGIPGLGVSQTGRPTHEPFYLVLGIDTELVVRPVPQRKGGVRYSIDQRENPTSIVWSPGGLHEPSRSLVRSDITTISADPRSLDLYKFFVSRLTRGFKTIEGFRVGPEARELYGADIRLMDDVSAPEWTALGHSKHHDDD